MTGSARTALGVPRSIRIAEAGGSRCRRRASVRTAVAHRASPAGAVTFLLAVSVVVALAAPAHAVRAPRGASVPTPVVAPDGAAARPSRAAALPEPTWTPPEVRDAADDVLDGAEFQRPEPNAFEKARAWVEERIGRVLQGLVTGDGASILGWIVLLGSVVAIGLLLARFGRSVQRDPTKAAAVSVERSRTASQWADEAERLE